MPGRKRKPGSRRARSTPDLIIGWREWVSLPDLGISHVKVKIDTGARTSALHAFDIVPFEREGKSWVRFRIQPIQRAAEPVVRVEAPLVDERLVRSSTGHISRRPVIRTTLVLSQRRWPVEITLVRRDLMGFRMLLGRQGLREHCRIDPGRSFLGGRPTTGEPMPEPVASHEPEDQLPDYLPLDLPTLSSDS